MNLRKILSLLLAFLLVIFVVVANFSATETRFQCNGSISGEPLKAFIKLQKYEWWVGLWSASEGMLIFELPNITINEPYLHLREAGDQIQIYKEEGEISGHFSTLSKAISLKTSVGFFDGMCTKINKE
jgi:hypothetical protein